MVLSSRVKIETAHSPGEITRQEVFQQPGLWPTTMRIVAQSKTLDLPANQPVILTGAGTSAYAAAAIAAAWPGARAAATTDLLIQERDEIESRHPGFADGGLLISLGRSGDSPESVAVVNRLERLCPKVEHLTITCNADGQLARMSRMRSIVLDPRTNDKSLAMTGSFSNLVLAGLCLRFGAEVESFLPQVCMDVERRLPEMAALAERLGVGVRRALILASGSLSPLATETSLKILEMTAGGTVTLAETFLGLRHGPMSFVTPNTLVLCFLSSSADRRRYEQDLIRELRQKGLGRIVGVIPADADQSLFDEWIPASAGHVRDDLRVPFEIPFAQLLAYHLSLQAGLDPDNPSPMGAITRVVRKFTIYDDEPHV
jgi:tagatose-6-phosphate ketose/aldose isomerase